MSEDASHTFEMLFLLLKKPILLHTCTQWLEQRSSCVRTWFPALTLKPEVRLVRRFEAKLLWDLEMNFSEGAAWQVS